MYFRVKTFDKKTCQKIPVYLIILGFIVLIGGYFQYFYYPDLRNLVYLGWDEHLNRMFSSFLDPNYFGIFLVLYLFFLLGYILTRVNRDLFFGFLVIDFVLTFIGIFLTFSRSAILALIVGSLCFALLKNFSRKIILTFGGIVLICLIIVLLNGRSYEGTNLLRTVSTSARITSEANGWKLFLKQPIFGVGFNAYRYAVSRYHLNGSKRNDLSHGGAGNDNSWIFVLVTTGVLGFLAYVNLWREVIYGNFKRRKENIFAVVTVASSVSLIISSFFVNSLFYPMIMMWMWILIGFTESM